MERNPATGAHGERESNQAFSSLRPRVAVVIAAYNESSALGPVVEDVRQHCDRVVVVDDGSGDSTAEVALAAGAHVVRHPINLGQGAALQTGIDYALQLGADFIVTFDADGQHASAEILPMVLHMVTTESDIVLGSRFLGRAVNIPRAKLLTLWVAVHFTRLTTGLRLTDTHNGFRALKAEAARRLRIRQNRMAHASEILEQTARLKLRYTEFPVTITYNAYSIAKGQRLLNSFAIVKDQLMDRLAK